METQTNKPAQPEVKATPVVMDKQERKERRPGNRRGGRDRMRKDAPRDDMQQRMIEVRRVTRVMAGGKRMSFRACVVVGDQKGQVGFGMAKAADVSQAMTKAANQARKNLLKIPLVNDTIGYQVAAKYKASRIMIKPAVRGTGVKAGGAPRHILELVGAKNVVAKIIGSANNVNIVKATLDALQKLHWKKSTFGKEQK